MSMNQFSRVRIAGTAMVVRGNDIDTDRIIPARYLKSLTFDDLGRSVFEDERAALRQAGKPHPFDQPRFAGASLLFVNKNFGCGSSREHAPQAIHRWGIKAIVGESFGEIFFGNSVALGMPCVTAEHDVVEEVQSIVEVKPPLRFELDLDALALRLENGPSFQVRIAEGPRRQFITGRWDATNALLEARDEILTLDAALPY
jgi:3-isopropylmalate/(R)-2-methylmalate dehydratase small subunit